MIPHISMPILIIHAKEDHVVPVSNAYEIFQTVASSEKKLVVLENSYHIVTADFAREQVYEEMRAFVEKVLDWP